MTISEPYFGDTFNLPIIQPLMTGIDVPISNANASSPIVVETNIPHSFETGDSICIYGNGNPKGSNNNGNFVATVIDSTHFSLNGTTGFEFAYGGYCQKTISNAGIASVTVGIKRTHSELSPVLISGTVVWDDPDTFQFHATFDQTDLWRALRVGKTYAIFAYSTSNAGVIETILSAEIKPRAR